MAFLVSTPDTAETVVDVGLTTADDAVTAGKYDYAVRLMTATEAAARGAKEAALVIAVSTRSGEIHWLQSENVRAKSAEQKLATAPGDADANFTSGRFLCLGKGDWKIGLQRMARGSNPGFRAVAAAELLAPTTPEKLVAVGDLWWDLGEKDLNGPQSFLRARAAFWYERALANPKFTGLNRARVEKRMSSVPRSAGSAPIARATTKPAKPATAPAVAPSPGESPVPPPTPVAPADPAPAVVNDTPPAKPNRAPSTDPPAPAPPRGGSIFSDK
jgi:hypothetical protein